MFEKDLEENNLKNVAKVEEDLKERYKKEGSTIYAVSTTLNIDDDTEVVYEFLFKKPNTSSYDRYVKTASTSSSKALKTFITDNIVDEQTEEIRNILEEYPAMAISVGEKLLYMLGLSKDTTVKKL